MSSLIWNNHTRNTASQASTDQSRLTTQEDSGNAISSQILAETKGNLPFINPETLERQKSLGRGTSFQVTCELFRKPGGPSYYVAVKHVVKDFSSFAEQERRLAVIKRELRVLMHPHLKTHSCVISDHRPGLQEGRHPGNSSIPCHGLFRSWHDDAVLSPVPYSFRRAARTSSRHRHGATRTTRL